MNVEEIEEKLNKLGELRFKDDYKPNNLKEVIDKIISNKDSSTYTKHSSFKNPQCFGGKSRGAADIYRTCKYYFPDVKLCEVLKHLKIRDRSFCSQTKRTVFTTWVGKYDHPKGLGIKVARRTEFISIEDWKKL